jgi:hypothetical protein
MLTAEHNFDLMSGVKSEKGGKLNRRRVCRFAEVSSTSCVPEAGV